MKALLILAGPYSSCDTTKNIWQKICLKKSIEFETYDLSDPLGIETARRLNVKSFPALIVNDKVVAVGHPSEELAEKVITQLEELNC